MQRALAPILLALAAIGCAAGHPERLSNPKSLRVEYGEPNRFVDGVGWVLGVPNKLALWDRRADNHAISPETEVKLVEYIEDNGLQDVLVRVNQYDPLGEWKRLGSNRKVGAGWRYTVGTLNMLKYTLLPGRLWGDDWYNPYTDTINLYSDLAPLALSEAAYAKDVRERDYPGGYSAVQELPIVGMWHETLASSDVLEYVESRGTEEEREETYRILYPDYGGSWGGQVASFLPWGSVFGRLAGAAVGHAANGVRSVMGSDEQSEFATEAIGDNASTGSQEWRFQ